VRQARVAMVALAAYVAIAVSAAVGLAELST
jgi:hypothetical protein